MSHPDAPQPGPAPISTDLSDLLEHADWLGRFALHLMRDGHEAEEALQETLAIATERGRRGALPDGGDRRAWLSGILKNVAQNRRRTAARRRGKEAEAGLARARPAGARSAGEDAALVEQQRELLRCIDGLSESQRRAVLARFYDGTPPRKIAAAEGVPVSTINSRIQRALEALRARLDERHGDRATWAALVMPLAQSATKKEAAAASGWMGGAAVIAAVAALVCGVLFLDPPERWQAKPESVKTALLSHPEGVETGAAGEAAVSDEATDAPAKSDTSRTTIPSNSSVLTVISEATGEPAAGAEVWYLSLEDPMAHQSELMQPVMFVMNQGTRVVADESGQVTLPRETRVFLVAATDDELGVGGWEAQGAAPALVIERAHRLTVKVATPGGSSLPEGVEVECLATFAQPEDPETGNQDWVSHEWRTVRGGTASFQNPWAGVKVGGEAPGPDVWVRCTLDAVYLRIPGAPEFFPDAIAATRFFPFRRKARRREFELVLPPCGSVQLEIVQGSHGEVLDGEAVLSFPGTTVQRRKSPTYTVPIRDGRAMWPQVAASGRAFEISVRLPQAGASWTVTGVSPAQENEAVTVRTVRPQRPSLQARLVDPQGRPLELDDVLLLYSRTDYGNEYMGGRVVASSGKDGRIRFEFDPEKPPVPPISINATRRRFFDFEKAVELLEVSQQQLDVGADLGDVVVALKSRNRISGIIVDESGAPVEGLRATVETPGSYGSGTLPSDSKGRFSYRGFVGPNSTIKAAQYHDVYLASQQALTPETKEVRLVVREGATFEVDFQAADAARWRDYLRVALVRQDDPTTRVGLYPDDESGKSCGTAIAPGRYDLQILYDGGTLIATIPDVAVDSGTTCRDARVDGFRGGDHFRDVSLTWEGASSDEALRGAVYTVGPDGSPDYLYVVKPGRPFMLPHVSPVAARFTVGKRVAFLSDVASATDSLHVVFEAPFAREVRITGESRPGFSYSLEGEWGSAAFKSYVGLPVGTDRSGPVAVRFPAPGQYRLMQIEEPTPAANGLSTGRTTRGTVEVIDVRRPTEGEPVEQLTIRVDAAMR